MPLVLWLVPLHAEVLSLAGSWTVKLDPGKVGAGQRWAAQPLPTTDVMFLPGSTDEAAYGTRTLGAEKDRLSRPFVYEGPAWYQRAVVIPESWRGKRIMLFLERAHWQTEAWVDGKPFGMQDSLSTPHEYDLTTALAPGRHLVTLCVDNSYKIDVGRRAHSVTDWTQTNWNGVIGRIELRAAEPVWIDAVRAYSNPRERTLRVDVAVRNTTGQPQDAELAAAYLGRKVAVKVTAAAEQKVALTIALPAEAKLWDEYEPALSPLQVTLSSPGGQDRIEIPYGTRQIAARGTQFVLNGRPIFLRGNLECVIFPKTGYPPMDAESWARLFRIARGYGLNSFRFHSWCPPEAAFAAADRAGFLLQVELPVWSNRVGKDQALDDYMRAEGLRILKTYGNHPSFTMLCLGNELTGDFQFMDKLVSEFKSADPRRLYTFSSDHVRRASGPTSDYHVTHNITAGRLRIQGTRFAKTNTGTNFDFSDLVKATPVPLVAHELGQWVTYPSYDEIAKYSGVLKARNLEVFRDTLAERGMSDQAAAFQQASGKFAWLAYKEDMETALRTPNLGGFQLLQLQDFPGQGEALIGLLDSFWDSKGILTPEEFRRFCSQTVPLLCMNKFVWTNDETFMGTAQVAHYGFKPVTNAAALWSIRDDAGREWGAGKFQPASLPLGSVTTLGEIKLPLSGIERATRLKITIRIEGAGARNDWDIWVYPKNLDTQPPRDLLVTSKFDAAARKKLADGGKVLLLWPRGASGAYTLETRFLPVFWSLSFFPKQTGTMGILCDPKNSALAGFPTDMHSNWQWWELTEGARAFILDETPAGFRPIVQVIDDYHRNHKLGAVFEARAGTGKLLVSALDIESKLEERPVARQLLHSLLKYAAGADFAPKDALPLEVLEKLFASANEGHTVSNQN